MSSDLFQPYIPPVEPAGQVTPKGRLFMVLRLMLKSFFFLGSFVTALSLLVLVMVSIVSPKNPTLGFFGLEFFEGIVVALFGGLSFFKFRLNPNRDDIKTFHLIMDLALIVVTITIFAVNVKFF